MRPNRFKPTRLARQISWPGSIHRKRISRAVFEDKAPFAIGAIGKATLIHFKPDARMAKCRGAKPIATTNGVCTIAADTGGFNKGGFRWCHGHDGSGVSTAFADIPALACPHADMGACCIARRRALLVPGPDMGLMWPIPPLRAAHSAPHSPI